MSTLRGIRGATTAPANEPQAILDATRELLEALVRANQLAPDDLAAAYFTATPDLNAAFPAAAARGLGWIHVPLLDAQEIAVPGSLSRCIRVLLLWNTETIAGDVQHIYLREARSLRPDLAQPAPKEGPR